MIIYGTFTETSVPKLFIAGVIPGLIMTALFMLYIGLHATLVPGVAPREPGARNLREVLRALADIAPFFLLIAGTLGGLYFGVVTTTEACRDRLLPVDPARLRVRRSDAEEAGRGDALDR
jgi:TRAP-type C4-dicarboxylate transport system permease large subunit